jgi:hypothetical protein
MPIFLVLGALAAVVLVGTTPAAPTTGTPGVEWTLANLRALAAAAHRLGMHAADLLLVIFSESGGHPWAQWPAHGYPYAAGLNQITRVAAPAAGLTEAQRADLVHWTVAQQIPVVERMFRNSGWPYSYPNAGVIYAVNFAPGRLKSRGWANDTVLYDMSDGAAYTQNQALDVNGDGAITIQDLNDHLRTRAAQPDYQHALRALRAATGDASLTPTFG